MYGYKLRLHSLPEILWACETTVSDYDWENRNSADTLELSLSFYDTATTTLNGRHFQTTESQFSCVVGDEPRRSSCPPGTTISIVSVAARCTGLSAQAASLTEQDRADTSVLLLPALLSPLTQNEALTLTRPLHRLIQLQLKPTESQKMLQLSEWLRLLQTADSLLRDRWLDPKNHKVEYGYVRKIDSIIENRFSEKITLQSIADELHLSPVYLSTLYNAEKGIHFSEQLLQTRLHHAELLLQKPHIPTARVAELCGFCDEHYFRKKFKAFFGVGVREYRAIKNGVALRHPAPVRPKE